jgi:hypothetical protein
MQSQPIPQKMRPAEAARYLREAHRIPCTSATLIKYARIGVGPAFQKAGKFLYSREDLDTWARSRPTVRFSDL